MPSVEVALADDGEVLMRGEVVMAGYRDDPARTAEAIDTDGRLHTGDIGTRDNGYLKIVDRKKDLIISAGGKNMSPRNIEAAIEAASPLIAHAVAIGDRRPYNVALVVLDADVLELAGTSADDPGIIAQVEAAIDAANAELSRVEQIKRFRIVDGPWDAGGDLVTPTLKLRRTAIAAHYAPTIEDLYAGAGQNVTLSETRFGSPRPPRAGEDRAKSASAPCRSPATAPRSSPTCMKPQGSMQPRLQPPFDALNLAECGLRLLR